MFQSQAETRGSMDHFIAEQWWRHTENETSFINKNTCTYFIHAVQFFLSLEGSAESDKSNRYEYKQFNSIQFICIAQFHKLQICLGVLYNLYT